MLVLAHPGEIYEPFVHVCMLSRVRLYETPWTVAGQVPLSMGFPKQEYWSRLSFPPSEDLTDPGIELSSPASPTLAGRFLTTLPTGKPLISPSDICKFFQR